MTTPATTAPFVTSLSAIFVYKDIQAPWFIYPGVPVNDYYGMFIGGEYSINEYPALFPQTPFGGYKQSGLGREKGLQAVDHFTQLKNVAVSLGDAEHSSFDH